MSKARGKGRMREWLSYPTHPRRTNLAYIEWLETRTEDPNTFDYDTERSDLFDFEVDTTGHAYKGLRIG